MHLTRFTLPELGRQFLGVTAKSGIKRVWRFIANHRVEPALAMQGVIAQVVRHHRKKPLILTLDWTQIRKHHVLMLAAVMRGRAVPLLWAVYDEKTLHRSQNSLEEALLRLLRTLVPRQVQLPLGRSRVRTHRTGPAVPGVGFPLRDPHRRRGVDPAREVRRPLVAVPD